MLTVFIRGIAIYILVTFSIRAMGKRQLGELSPSELVITILISNIATLSMEDLSIPLIRGVVPILTLVCLDILASYASLKSRRLRSVISGGPRIVISGGRIDQQALKELRFTIDDLCAALRSQGIFDITTVQYAVVETTGNISALLKNGELPLTKSDAGCQTADEDPPITLISYGDILPGLTPDKKRELIKSLKRKQLGPSEVLLCLERPDGSLAIIKKSGKGA